MTDDLNLAPLQTPKLCSTCRQNEPDLSDNPNADLCARCREERISLNVPMKIRLFIIIVLAFFLFALSAFMPTVGLYKTYIEAGRHAQKHEYAYALQKYMRVLEVYPNSVKVALNALYAAQGAQDFDAMVNLINDHLYGKSLNDKQYALAQTSSGTLDILDATISAVMAVDERAAASNNPDAALRVYRNGLNQLLDQKGISNEIVYGYLAMVAEDVAGQVHFLQKAVLDPRFTYLYASYGNRLRTMGRMDEARRVYMDALALNACDAGAIKGIAILECINGDKAKALETIRTAYALLPRDGYMPEAYLMLLKENGLMEEASVLIDELTQEGYPMDTEFEAYWAGEISYEQYYVKEAASI